MADSEEKFLEQRQDERFRKTKYLAEYSGICRGRICHVGDLCRCIHSIMSICQEIPLCVYRYTLQPKSFRPARDEEFEGEGPDDEGDVTNIANENRNVDVGTNEHMDGELEGGGNSVRRRQREQCW